MEYQRIKLVWHGLYRLCPGASTAACVSAFCGGGCCWERCRGAWFVGVVFGALLGPEATGPFCSNAEGIVLVFLLFLLPVLPRVPVWGGGGLVDGVVV